MSAEDLTGKRFGKLVVIHRVEDYVHPSGERKPMWLCQCDCGERNSVRSHTLKSGFTQSCGCGMAESGKRKKTHGLSKSKTYKAWCSIKNRCYNPRCSKFMHYGGKGIKVCPAWLNSFSQFLKDVGIAPTNKHSIDRINTDGDYEPSNCRWAVQSDQMRNQCRNVKLTHNGITLCIADWADRLGLKRSTVYGRHSKGWPVEKILWNH